MQEDGNTRSPINSSGTMTPTATSSNGFVRNGDEELALDQRKALNGASPKSKSRTSAAHAMVERLDELVKAYEHSSVAEEVKAEIENASQTAEGSEHVPPTLGYLRASWWTQFTILSGRAFKNLYRNPMLMLTHYLISILIARRSTLFNQLFLPL